MFFKNIIYYYYQLPWQLNIYIVNKYYSDLFHQTGLGNHQLKFDKWEFRYFHLSRLGNYDTIPGIYSTNLDLVTMTQYLGYIPPI